MPHQFRPKTELTEAQQHTLWKEAKLTPMQRRVWWLYFYGDARHPNYSWQTIAKMMRCRYAQVTRAFREANAVLIPLFDAEIERLRVDAELMRAQRVNPDEERLRYEVTVYAGADCWAAPDNTQRGGVESAARGEGAK